MKKVFGIFSVIIIISNCVLQAQWVQSNGPYSAHTHAMVTSGSNLVLGTNGGIYLSSNNGANWTGVNNELSGYGILSLVSTNNYVFAGTNGNGIYYSSNNGLNWNSCNFGLTSFAIFTLAASGTDLFAGAYGGGIFYSSDLGRSWTKVNNGLTNLNVSSIVFSNENLIALTDGGGLFLSTNKGANWTPITNLPSASVTSITASGSDIFAGTSYNGIMHSTNNGTNWVYVNNGLTSYYPVSSITVFGSNIFAIETGSVLVSSNNGANWESVNNGLDPDLISSIYQSNNLLFGLSYDHGIFISSDNGSTWSSANNGLLNINIPSITASSNGNLYATTDGAGVFLSTDNGTSWNTINNGLAYLSVEAFAIYGNNLFAGTTGGVYISTNNGNNWIQINGGLTNTQVLSFAVSDSNLYVGTYDGVYKFNDSYKNWTLIKNGLTSLNIRCLAVTPTGINLNRNLFAGTDIGLFVSTNNGANWNIVHNGFPNAWVYSLLYSGTSLFAGTNNGLYLSTDNGANWTLANNGISPNSFVMSIVALSNKILFAGTNGGDMIYLSSNSGASWNVNSAGLPLDTQIWSLAASENNLFAGTTSSIWKRPLSDMGLYTITTQIDPLGAGTAQGNGIYFNGDLATVSSAPLSGSKFLGWFENGALVSSNANYTFNVSSNRTLVAKYLNLPSTPVADAVTNIKQTSFNANWEAAGSAAGYYLDVAIDNQFVNILSSYNKLNVHSSLTYLVENLSPAGTYYYRVYSYNDAGNSLTPSKTITVTTLPLVPNSPVAQTAAEIKSTSFKANWAAVTGATGYYLDIATDDQFIHTLSGFSKFDAGNSLTYLVNNLSSKTIYYYRVYSYNIAGKSLTSSNTITVTTLPLAPDAPVAAAGSNIKQTSFNANWQAANSATGYYLDVAIDNKFVNLLSSFNKLDVGNKLTYLIDNLPAGSTIYYRVFAYNEGGMSLKPSDTVTVNTLPLAPNTPVAQIAAEIKATSFKANWTAVTGATGYYLDIATDDQFADTLHRFNEFDAGNTRTCLVENLTPASKYYYRVYSYNTGGKSLTPSNTITVTTLPLAPNSPVAQAATNQKETSFTASWTAVTGATGYYLDIAIDEGLKNLLIDYNKKDVGNVTSFQISGLPTKTDYYYDVIAYNTGGESNISNSIKVSLISGIERLNSIPTVFELNQNYPNPFNPTTKINYAIPKPGFVKINIYNVLGTLVKSLVNENQATGYYSIELNAGSLGSGIYFYRMESGSFSQTKKLLLLK